MNETVLKEHLSRFEKKLKRVVADSVQTSLPDHEVIVKRSRWAANAYVGALTAGNPETECEKIATDILLDGLYK